MIFPIVYNIVATDDLYFKYNITMIILTCMLLFGKKKILCRIDDQCIEEQHVAIDNYASPKSLTLDWSSPYI